MTMLCKICNDSEAKYKCSTCFYPYCSLACWKNHKSQNDCQPAEKVVEDRSEPPKVETKYFTEDTIHPDKLTRLGESVKLREILKNKYLQHTLLAVENASNAEKAVFEAMRDPDFVSFVDECLKIVEEDCNG